MAKLPATSMGPGFHPDLADQNNCFTVHKDQTAVPAKNFLMQPTMVSLNCIYFYNYSFFIPQGKLLTCQKHYNIIKKHPQHLSKEPDVPKVSLA